MDTYPHLTPPVRMFIRMLEESIGNKDHVFLCGSRRFGYHLDSSDTDITICLPNIGRYPLLKAGELEKVLWFLKHKITHIDTGDYDSKLFGIQLFHIEVLDIHLRVHHDINDFNTEKKEHDIIESKITPKEIYDWQDKKLKYIVSHRTLPSGTSFYLELRRKYLDDTSVTKRTRNWFHSFFANGRKSVNCTLR